MRIAITGSTGLVGTATTAALRAAGHDVVRLVRSRDANDDTARWDPATGDVELDALGLPDAVVHLAGANVAGGRWTKARKALIHDSRGPATTKLCATLAKLPQPPKVFVSASATGIYAPSDEVVDERTPIAAPGASFLGDVARAWEAGAQPLADAGARCVHVRISMVLSKDGGALQSMLLPFKLGLGGRLGSGEQWMSWITRADLVRVIDRALSDDALSGPVLAASPNPVQNREFTKVLGEVLSRPTILPAPRFALRLVLGEMADALLLASHRADPQRLREVGFAFEHPELERALRAVLAE